MKVFFALCCLMLPFSARAEEIIIDVSTDLIEIDTNFNGASLVVFGAAEKGDVVVTLKGPRHDIPVYKKHKTLFGIWMNSRRFTFKNLPSVYHMASSKPIERLAEHSILRRGNIGIDNIFATPSYSKDILPFKTALIDTLKNKKLYSQADGKMVLQGGKLFKYTITLPAEIPTGRYEVEAFLFQDGHMITAQTKAIHVRKVGFGAQLFRFSRQDGLLYGLAAVLMGLFFGLFGGLGFRRS